MALPASVLLCVAVFVLASVPVFAAPTSWFNAASPAPKTVNITFSNCAGGKAFCYKPATLTVPRNTKVVWKNKDLIAHTVTRCTVAKCGVSGGTGTDLNFKSPSIKAGGTFAFTFRHAGTYRYYCKPHGYKGMHGIITVR